MDTPTDAITAHSPGWCIYYNGMAFHDTCKAAVTYSQVRDQASGRRGLDQYPCFQRPGVPDSCAPRRYPTPEEVEAFERESAEAVRRMVEDLVQDCCPHCHKPVGGYHQVGRSVYATSCGHRLYQGKVPRRKAL